MTNNAAGGLNKNLFISKLKNNYLFNQDSEINPYQCYVGKELFVIKSSRVDNVACYQSYITSKGLNIFLKIVEYFIIRKHRAIKL